MISFGQPYYGWLTAIHTAVFNLTSKLGIDLIMYGEDGEVEYGGTTKTQNRFLYDNKYVEQVYLSDVYKKIFKKIKLNQDDKFFYELSSSKRIKHCHYSYFEIGIHIEIIYLQKINLTWKKIKNKCFNLY